MGQKPILRLVESNRRLQARGAWRTTDETFDFGPFSRQSMSSCSCTDGDRILTPRSKAVVEAPRNEHGLQIVRILGPGAK